MTKLLIVALATSTLLSGCAGMTVDDFNAMMEPIAAQSMATMQSNTQQMQIQAQNYQAPEVMQVKQPNGTTFVYCRNATNNLYVCRQLN